MKWRWYTTWWLLPCVPSLSDHHDLSSLPFRPLFLYVSPSSLFFYVSRFLPLFPLGKHGRPSCIVRHSAVWFFRPAHLVSSPSNPPRSPQGRRNIDGSLRPCRRIAADRSPSHQDSFVLLAWLVGWLVRWLGWLVGQHPPLVEYRRVAASCVSSHFALPFGERAVAIPFTRSAHAGDVILRFEIRIPLDDPKEKYVNKWGREIRASRGQNAEGLRYPSAFSPRTTRILSPANRRANAAYAILRTVSIDISCRRGHANATPMHRDPVLITLFVRAVLFILKRKKRFPFIRHEQYLFIIHGDTWRNYEMILRA